MKILIAGFGSIGRRHFRNLLALGEKDIVFYRSGRSTLDEDEIRGYAVETDLEKALAHRPQAVVVATPTARHLEIALPAARAGCAILLEKPVSHSLEGVEALREAAQKSGSRILVGFQFRFHPGLQKIAALLQSGAVGRPLSARAHWGEYLPDWHPWEDYRQSYAARSDLGGGVTLTLCHPLDYIHWLFGKVDSLSAYAGHFSDLEVQVEDTAEISLRFQSQALGSIHLNYYQRPPVHTLEIAGSLGSIRWDNADGNVRLYRAEAASPGWETFLVPEGFERNWLFLDEMRHFIAVAKGQAQPLCSLEDGIYALKLALAASQSAQEMSAQRITG